MAKRDERYIPAEVTQDTGRTEGGPEHRQGGAAGLEGGVPGWWSELRSIEFAV